MLQEKMHLLIPPGEEETVGQGEPGGMLHCPAVLPWEQDRLSSLFRAEKNLASTSSRLLILIALLVQ